MTNFKSVSLIGIVWLLCASPVVAQTRLKGGVKDEEGDLQFSDVLPRVQTFWRIIGRGTIEPSAIRWRKEKSIRGSHVFIIFAGGATLQLNTRTGNVASFVDNKRRKEQRSPHEQSGVRRYANESAERQAVLSLAHGLGFSDAEIVHFEQLGQGITHTENSARRFGARVASSVAQSYFTVAIDSVDGHVTELFVGWIKNSTFRMCMP